MNRTKEKGGVLCKFAVRFFSQVEGESFKSVNPII